MTQNRYFLDCKPVPRVSTYVTFVDVFFYLCIFLQPFSHIAIDRETGEGAFLKIFYGILFVLVLPAWKMYLRHWKYQFLCCCAVFVLGYLVDIAYLGSSYAIPLLFLLRQSLIGIVLGVIAYNMILRDARHIKWLMAMILIGAISSAVAMWVGLGTKEHIEGGMEGVRMSVVGQNSNYTGLLMSFYLIFLIMTVSNTIPLTKTSRFLLLCFSPFVFVSLIKVASRGAVLTLLFSLPLILITTQSISKKILYILLGVLGSVGLIVVILSSDMLRSRFENMIYNRDTGGREGITHIAFEIWKESPIFGVGANHHQQLIAYRGNDRGMLRSTHNTYTNALCSSGLIGLTLYLCALLPSFAVAYRNRWLGYGNYFFVLFFCEMLVGLFYNIEMGSLLYLTFALIYGFNFHVNNLCNGELLKV